MTRRIRQVGAGLFVTLLAVAMMGSSAYAGKPKPQLNLKKAGTFVPDGTAVGGGWVGGIELSKTVGATETTYEYYGCELEGTMTLTVNGNTKADKAVGKVGVPDEECGTYEFTTENEAPDAKKLGRVLRRAKVAKHRSIRDTAPAKEVAAVAGELTSEEMTTKETGTLEMSTGLSFVITEGTKKCGYVSKTKLKGEWPAEEYPGTADIEAEYDYKLSKSLSNVKTGCTKTLEGYIEAWVGPNFEELEAELTA
jgi:hypothetical protein